MINQNYEFTNIDFYRFSELVREKSGIEISSNRQSDLKKAVCQTAFEFTFPDLEKFYQSIIADITNSSALQALIERLTIGETSFMRIQPHFEALEKYILPEIIERKKDERKIRVWSAGCASGEEPYSLAILFKKLLINMNGWDVKILGTDINTQVLKKAKTGIYGNWSFRNVSVDFQDKYFNPSGNLFQIRPEYRQLVQFGEFNLASHEYSAIVNNLQSIDLILCRNVFIYFSEDFSQLVTNKFYTVLADPGWLIVGPSETSQTLFQNYQTYNFPDTIVYQKCSQYIENEFHLVSKSNKPCELKDYCSPNWAREDVKILEAKADGPGKIRLNLQNDLSPFNSPTSNRLSDSAAEETRQSLKKKYEQEGNDHLAAYQLAKDYANHKSLTQAAEWIQKTLERNSLFAPAHYLNSQILDEQGNSEESIAAIRRCLYLDPKFLMGYYKMAEFYKKTNQKHRFQKTILMLEKELARLDENIEIPEGEGLTAQDLTSFVANQKELLI
jgi:chemotaxis protein methyltransferase CheR